MLVERVKKIGGWPTGNVTCHGKGGRNSRGEKVSALAEESQPVIAQQRKHCWRNNTGFMVDLL